MKTSESKKSSTQAMRTSSPARTSAFIGLAVALIAVSSWVTIPIGPIPFTLQMLAIPLVICVLPMPWAIGAVAAYIVLGVCGVPVFSGFRGGFGVIMGPTGGFLLGYIPGAALGAFFLHGMRKRLSNQKAIFACEVASGLIFTLIAYLTGWIQYAYVAGVSLEAAFLVSVAPFIVPDIIKALLAALCAHPIRKALKPM